MTGFGLLAGAYCVITIYFCWRFYLRRRLPSLVCAWMPLGWIFAFAMAFQRIPDGVVPLVFGAGLLFGLGSIGIILRHELSRPRPFS